MKTILTANGSISWHHHRPRYAYKGETNEFEVRRPGRRVHPSTVFFLGRYHVLLADKQANSFSMYTVRICQHCSLSGRWALPRFWVLIEATWYTRLHVSLLWDLWPLQALRAPLPVSRRGRRGIKSKFNPTTRILVDEICEHEAISTGTQGLTRSIVITAV